MSLASCTVFNGLSAIDRDGGADADAINSNDSATTDTRLPDLQDSSSGDGAPAETTVEASIDSAMDTSMPIDTSVVDTSPLVDTAPLSKAERYRAAVIADGPLLYLRLDEAPSNPIAADSSGNARDCAYLGAAERAIPGAMTASSAVRLNSPGDNENIECASSPFEFGASASFTLEAWIKPDLVDTTYPRIFSKEVASPRSGYSVSIKQGATTAVPPVPHQVIFERWDGGTLKVYAPVDLPLSSEWVHLAAVWDGSTSTVKLYLNASPFTKVYSALTFGTNTNALTVGLSSSGVGGSYRGAIDEVAVYSTALSAARIASHISAATAP